LVGWFCVADQRIDCFAGVLAWQMDEETALEELARAAEGVDDAVSGCLQDAWLVMLTMLWRGVQRSTTQILRSMPAI
jgi:hypothetical protein